MVMVCVQNVGGQKLFVVFFPNKKERIKQDPEHAMAW